MNTPLNKLDDLTGSTFGMLTVIARAENDKFGSVYWRCRCECGEIKLVRASTLRAGKFFTCGKQGCRFWEKVHRPEGDGCWEWIGAVKETGYGVMKVPGEKTIALVHHYSWFLHNAPVPQDLFVLHKCDNRKCVRPDHLFLGTHQDNMDDMVAKGRHGGKGRRLSREEKLKMVAEYRQGGLSHPDLAEKYGVSLKTVGRTLRGVSRQEH